MRTSIIKVEADLSPQALKEVKELILHIESIIEADTPTIQIKEDKKR